MDPRRNGQRQQNGQHRQNEFGFILIEVVFTLTMISIISCAAIFTWRRQLERIALEQYAEQIKADITYSQEEAIRTHSIYVWSWLHERPAYRILVNNHLILSRDPPLYIKYKLNYYQNRMEYNFYGRNAYSGQIVLTNDFGDIRSLVLYMNSGQVRIIPYIL